MNLMAGILLKPPLPQLSDELGLLLRGGWEYQLGAAQGHQVEEGCLIG